MPVRFRPVVPMINNVMQLEIYINDKLWKTVTLDNESYQPGEYWTQINHAQKQGLLSSFNVDQGMKVEFRKIQ